jgi:GST-like protein
MLHLYTWHTPNGRKPTILLAELEVEFELHLIDLQQQEQKSPEFLSINPNGKIPALVDRGGDHGDTVVFESGAVLQYLAEKTGRFLPREPQARMEVLSWLYWQVGGPGPFFGQWLAFGHQEPRNAAAFQKFSREAKRLIGVLNQRLEDRQWIAREYSIADIAAYPWFVAAADFDRSAFEDAEAVQRWMQRMGERPAVARGMAMDF